MGGDMDPIGWKPYQGLSRKSLRDTVTQGERFRGGSFACARRRERWRILYAGFRSMGLYFNAEDKLAYRVRARLREYPVDGGTVAALGAWGGDTSNYLTSDDLGVRTAAAFHDRSEAGTAALIEVLSDPKTEDVWEQTIELNGRIDDVVEELVARDLSGITEAERKRLESLPVFCLSIYYQPWKPFLQLINIGNGNGVLNTEATARFLGAVVDDNDAWSTSVTFTTDALKKAGLPADREELRKLVKSMRD